MSLRSALGLIIQFGLLNTPAWALPLVGVNAFIFSSTFDSGFSEWKHKQLCCSHSAELVSSPVRGGSKALKVTYRKTDYTTHKYMRAELEGVYGPSGVTRWYGLSVYVPTSFKTTEGGYIITQFHDRPDTAEKGKVPPLYLVTNGKNLKLGNRWDTRKITPDTWDVQRQDWDLGLLPRGRWIDFVFHVKWSYKSDGILEVFQDGKMVVSKRGPNSYNDELGPYMKIGMYASGIRSKPEKYDFDEQVLYFDEVWVQDSSAGNKVVAPQHLAGISN